MIKKNANALAVAAALLVSTAGANAQAITRGPSGFVALPTPQVATQPAPADAPVSQAASVRFGILVLNLTINISSNIPTTTPIKCQFTPSVYGFDPTSGVGDFLDEYSQVIATRNGATASCSVRVPYYWTINGANAALFLSYSVEAVDADGNGRRAGIPTFISGGLSAGLAIPANGANTVFSRTVRL